jgi:ParB-like chromosome segregation protein Spo0J
MSNVDEAPFQLFPALDAATEAALTASIERFGVLVPVVVDQHGQCLDGHHRRRIADRLGVKYRVDVVQVAGDEEGREIARSLNSDRRHLDVEQRREVVAALREQGHSLRAIAEAVGASKDTVQRDLATVSPETVPDRTIGLDGKSRPSTRPTVVAAKNQKEADRAQQALTAAPDAMPDGRVLDVKRAERIAREAEADKTRAAVLSDPVKPTTVGNVEIRHCDFRTGLTPLEWGEKRVLLEDEYGTTEYDTHLYADGDVEWEHPDEEGSDLAGLVDAIITDPPYPAEFVELFEHLGIVADRLLKPTGVLVCMTGQYHLPSYIELLSRNLSYRWTCAYMIPGQRNRNHGARVGTGWKPLLVFQKHDAEVPEFLLDDVFSSEGDDKDHHHWGQSESGMAAIVERFTNPGQLVVDPFLGGGTTGIVCRDLGRRFVGCDIDAAAVKAATERVA